MKHISKHVSKWVHKSGGQFAPKRGGQLHRNLQEQDNSSNYVITDVNGRNDLYIQIPTGQSQDLQGVYTFTLSKDTLSIKTGNITIKKGQTVTQNFVMNVDGFVVPEETVAAKEKVSVEK